MEIRLQQEHNENGEQNNAYSLYLFGMRSPVTRDTYLRRLRTFFNHIQLHSNEESMEVRCIATNNFIAIPLLFLIVFTFVYCVFLYPTYFLPDAYYNKGLELMNAGKSEEAIALFDRS